jgi:hypothetical protein
MLIEVTFRRTIKYLIQNFFFVFCFVLQAALEALKKDLTQDPSLAAQYGVKLKNSGDIFFFQNLFFLGGRGFGTFFSYSFFEGLPSGDKWSMVSLQQTPF